MRAERSALAVTLAVWKALFLREALTRVSGQRGAWAWLLLEPVAHVAVLMVMFSTIRQRTVPGFDFALFLAVGILGFGLFKSAALRSMRAISANAALFAYRQGKPVDTVLIRAFLEGVLQLLVALSLLAGASLVGYDVLPRDPLTVMAAFGLLWLFGLGLGLVLSVGITLVPELGNIVDMAFFPLYFLSGIMYVPSMVPPQLRPWLLLNPLIHGVELLRAPFFPVYHALPGVNLGYLAGYGLLSLFLGLALHIRFSEKLVTL